MVKWAMELSEYDLGYQPRTAIKTQAFADFIADGVSFGSTEVGTDQTRPDGEVKDVHAGRTARTRQLPKTTKAVQIRETAEVLRTGDTVEVAQASQVAEPE